MELKFKNLLSGQNLQISNIAKIIIQPKYGEYGVIGVEGFYLFDSAQSFRLEGSYFDLQQITGTAMVVANENYYIEDMKSITANNEDFILELLVKDGNSKTVFSCNTPLEVKEPVLADDTYGITKIVKFKYLED